MEHNTNTLSIKEYLAQDEKKDLLRLLTAGSVDDGKSTLIGRLLFDSKRLYEDQLTALERDSKRVGHAGENIDYALLLDGLKAEREQGITIDVAYRYFSTNKRKFIIADTPGHEQYTRNMVTGASTANLAIILVDAKHGVITQTKRHTFLISLLGIKHVILAVNKMDLVDYKEEVFNNICEKYKTFITRLNIPDVHFIPMSALRGDNVVNRSENMPWYKGEPILELLETIHVSSDRNFVDLRYPVQYVLRPEHHFRGFSAKVASGIIRKGDEVMILPSRKTSKVKKIVSYDGDQDYAFPPESVTVTLKDEIDISRGDMLVHINNQPRMERHFEAMLVWMDEKKMNPNTNFIIKQTTNLTKARIDTIRYKINVNTMHRSETDHFKLNEIGRVVITTNKTLFFDAYERNHETGSFILIDPVTHNTSAVGMIIDRVSSEDLPNRMSDSDRKKIDKGESLVSTKERTKKYQQKGQTIWITGLHGSGKTDVAYMLEKRLFDLGHITVLLDGEKVRAGLSKELDYSSVDRAEHLRRVAEVCRLLNEQGIITICTFISPLKDTREQISDIIGKDRFNLIYMSTDLDTSKVNKPELYKLAEESKLQHLAGVDFLYEVPENPDVTLDIENKNIEAIVEIIQNK
ncbi:MAG: sulfate adenylyltransferase subunit CysN [Candidatus Marinimicrobia bacterium]|nr:sulfate adenylyltransferase subunit CysN [Candidatus Neomarinimicrobiota bacterium]